MYRERMGEKVGKNKKREGEGEGRGKEAVKGKG
jgi:hypothetical protein